MLPGGIPGSNEQELVEQQRKLLDHFAKLAVRDNKAGFFAQDPKAPVKSDADLARELQDQFNKEDAEYKAQRAKEAEFQMDPEEVSKQLAIWNYLAEQRQKAAANDPKKAKAKEEDEKEEPISPHTIALAKLPLDLANKKIGEPVFTFTPEAFAVYQKHFKSLNDVLKEIFNSAVEDRIVTSDQMPNPAYIFGEGRVIDRNILERRMKGDEGIAVMDQRKYTQKDIMPFNTLILAQHSILQIACGINVEPKSENIPGALKEAVINFKMEKKKPIINDELKKVLIDMRNSPDMLPKHKRLFDIMCCDPVTGNIIDDPVITPDGFVMDRSTALALLSYSGGAAKCIMNQNITFNKIEDCSPCYSIEDVLTTLGDNAQKVLDYGRAMRAKAQAGAQAHAAAPAEARKMGI